MDQQSFAIKARPTQARIKRAIVMSLATVNRIDFISRHHRVGSIAENGSVRLSRRAWIDTQRRHHSPRSREAPSRGTS